jgi:hypothetical protein
VDDSRRFPLTAAELSCGSCGTELSPNSKFCNECGSPVTQVSRSAEYKQVTVLFADVVHSMDIAATLGAERLREIMADLADRCAAVVQRFGDIAAVAAVCLCRAGHESQTYVLTGPEPITPRQQAAAISSALGGAPIEFVEQTRAQAMAELQRVMPPVVAERTLDALGAPTPEEQQVSQDLPRVLGRNAAPFAEWVSRHVDAFR